MFYLANVITFSVFSELLWEFYLTRTLHFKLILASTGETVWYLCNVIWRLRQVHTVRLKVILWLYIGDLATLTIYLYLLPSMPLASFSLLYILVCFIDSHTSCP